MVLGPGTGLGEAQLFWDEIQGGYKVWPSEGSHSGFAPRGWKQRALQARPLLIVKLLLIIKQCSTSSITAEQSHMMPRSIPLGARSVQELGLTECWGCRHSWSKNWATVR